MAESRSLANKAIKGPKRRVVGATFRKEFKKLVRHHKSQNAAARHLGFKSTTEAPLQTLLKRETRYCDTHYADHLAKFLGIAILAEIQPKVEEKENASAPPVQNVPPIFVTAYSDFNLFKISESDNTLALVEHDCPPTLKAQLQQFKKHNADLFTPRKTWQEAKDTLRECDRRWAQGGC